MTELRTLLSLELRSLFGINRFHYTKDKKAKNRYRLLLGAFVILIVTAFSYVAGLVYGLCSLGLGDIVPVYLVVLASMLILVFGIFTAGSRIFGQKGYDILASMPLRAGNIVLSRFLSLYAEDLALTLLIMLPGAVSYGVFAAPDLSFYLLTALGSLLIPAIPLVISTVFGSIVLAISSRMKSKSLVQSLLMVGFVLVVLLGSFGLGAAVEDFTPEAFVQLAQSIRELLTSIYPPALWLGNAMLGDGLDLACFVLLSLGLMAAAIWLASRYFHAIARRMQSFSAGHDYQLGAMESRGLLKTLYLRELRRYFASSIYVTNTIVGPILGAIMAIALCVTGLDSLGDILPVNITGLLPFVFAAVFCMMTTSCTSISMEGKQFWVVKSLPIPTKPLLDSKILLNLSLMLPCYTVLEVALMIAARPDVLELLWLLLIPALISLFAVVFGITVNLKFHSFDWEKEETVVKQSLPAVLGGFSGFFVSAVLGFAVFAVPGQYGDAVKALICVLLLALTAFLYRKNNKAVLSTL